MQRPLTYYVIYILGCYAVIATCLPEINQLSWPVFVLIWLGVGRVAELLTEIIKGIEENIK